jgi:hypothetical protein
MENDKITIEDICVMIDRLKAAIDLFKAQLISASINNTTTAVKRPRKETELDGTVRDFYKRLANRWYGMDPKLKAKYLNPTQSEFAELKKEYLKVKREGEREESNRIAGELSVLTRIAIPVPADPISFSEGLIIAGRIIIGRASDGGLGPYLVEYVNSDKSFPLEVISCRQNFKPGIKRYYIEAPNDIFAIIDPANFDPQYKAYLFRLAVDRGIYFKGLVYLKTNTRIA